MLWLGLSQGIEPFVQLVRSLERALSIRGFAPEGRDFSAHLTLGRVREPGRDWTADLEGAAAPEGAAASFEVGAIEVVESKLAPGGSIHTVRARAEMAGPPG